MYTSKHGQHRCIYTETCIYIDTYISVHKATYAVSCTTTMLCTTVVHSHVNAIVHILQDCTAKYCGMDSETGGTKTTLVEITPRIISGMPRMCQINSASIYTLHTEAQLTNQKQSPPTFSSSSKSLGTTRISRYEQNRRKTSATTDTALTMVFTREPRNVPNLRTETHITI